MTSIPTCGRCGSAVLHHIRYGLPAGPPPELPNTQLGGCLVGPSMWTTECVSCGRRGYWGRVEEGDWPERDEGGTPAVAAAVTGYAARLRTALGLSSASACSPFGLWLLLASLAPAADGPGAARVAEVLGLPVEDAAGAARRLLAEPHPTVASALGAWAAAPLRRDVPVDVATPIPAQEELDAWAAEHTRGLVETFPGAVDDATGLLLATALVLEPRWLAPLRPREDGYLELRGGLQTIVDTRAAGPVAVAKPHTTDGVDVVSVVAAPEVSPEDIWSAVDEVVARLDEGGLWHGTAEVPLDEDGHAWRVWDEVMSFPAGQEPEPDGWARTSMWTCRMPRWRASTVTDLGGAPGVDQVASALSAALGPGAGATSCVQSAVAEYDEDGFTAAAVTAVAATGGVPQMRGLEVRRVELNLTRPHALVAIARGGAWEGVPLFQAWVTPDLHVPPATP